MANIRNINKTVSVISINDRRKELFENMWPLPNGVAYNSYLINDEKTALLDTIEGCLGDNFSDYIADLLEGKELDYLVINHMEPDHSSEIRGVVIRFPNIKIVGNSKTFNILSNYYPISESNFIVVKDGDTISLGSKTLKFVFTPWLHWPETMMTYLIEDKILFSGDAFGSFGTLDGGMFDDEINFEKYYEDDMRRYYSNIVGKYSKMVQKALTKLALVEVNTICALHGPIWRENPAKVIGLYDKWSKQEGDNAVVVLYASMYGNTADIADFIAKELSECGVKDIRVYDVSKTHVSYIISEIWRCKGVILGSCAYNTYMHPMMEQVVTEMDHYSVQNKFISLFGSHSWNGGGVKNLKVFVENSSLELVGEPVDILGRPSKVKLEACRQIAVSMAEKLKVNFNLSLVDEL